jgi:hypothetical protein
MEQGEMLEDWILFRRPQESCPVDHRRIGTGVSLMSVASGLLSIGPRIRKDGGSLIATTGWRFALLTLGAIWRRVEVDAVARAVCIHSRSLWLFGRTRTIRFRDIQAVTYGYADWSPDSIFAFAHDAIDVFSTGLRLYDDREVGLFTFFGDGSFTNDGPFPDWCYWTDYAFDMTGCQSKESRLFVDLLSKMLGVTVEPPRD